VLRGTRRCREHSTVGKLDGRAIRDLSPVLHPEPRALPESSVGETARRANQTLMMAPPVSAR
jgi:hypothetical protein